MSSSSLLLPMLYVLVLFDLDRAVAVVLGRRFFFDFLPEKGRFLEGVLFTLVSLKLSGEEKEGEDLATVERDFVATDDRRVVVNKA